MNSAQNDEVFTRFRADVESLEVFSLTIRSIMGRMGHRANFRITEERVAKLMVSLGQLTMRYRSLAGVCVSILRSTNINASVKDWEVSLFAAAAAALTENYVDIDRATGPEPCRWSEATRPYTTAEKLQVMETLRAQCDDYIGVGWAAERLAHELGTTLVVSVLRR